MRRYYIIDRIEEGTAVCEAPDGQMIRIAAQELPWPIPEGALVFVDENGRWQFDEQATTTRRQQAAQKYSSLFKKKQPEE